ncbi:translation initiation factor IF-2 subunit gamma [archaeon]|nr:translation initiation factor IF-2 subunit gamma [archaeon]
MTRQKEPVVLPEVSIGTAGHVDHGKTTLLYAITGIWAAKHSEELKRGITIRIGFADVNIYKCPSCEGFEAYTTQPVCPNCLSETEFQRRISFVDCPGHDSLMSTMLAGTAAMDGAMLVIAANEPCPRPQTKEHTLALSIIGVENVVVVQSKIELVSKEDAYTHYQSIREFLSKTPYASAPVIPVSAHQRVNLDVVLWAIQEYIPTPERDTSLPFQMPVLRSFDVNKPGTPITELKGGVIGGAPLQGIVRVGDELEIRPGVFNERQQTYEPLYAEVLEIRSGRHAFDQATPGGLIAIQTDLDPFYTKSDSLVGNLAGAPGSIPEPISEVEIEHRLFEAVVGTEHEIPVAAVRKGEPLIVTHRTTLSPGVVTEVRKDAIVMRLKRPICAQAGDRVALSRLIQRKWRLIGYGFVRQL